MADCIKELIVKNVKAALETITVANGYANTVLSVQRPLPLGNVFELMPMIGLTQEDDERIGVSEPYITKRFVVAAVIMTRIDAPTDARAVEDVLNSLAADVEKAMTKDAATCKRGGYAIDTTFLDTAEYVPQEGMPDVGIALRFEITYRHRVGDPYTQ